MLADFYIKQMLRRSKGQFMEELDRDAYRQLVKNNSVLSKELKIKLFDYPTQAFDENGDVLESWDRKMSGHYQRQIMQTSCLLSDY